MYENVIETVGEIEGDIVSDLEFVPWVITGARVPWPKSESKPEL